MNIDLKKIEFNKFGHFRFRQNGNLIILTNEIGWNIILGKKDFELFLTGKLNKKSLKFKELYKKGFIKNKKAISEMAKAYAEKNHFLFSGPSLHIFVLTGRCNNKCIYCHASAHNMTEKNLDMTTKTAKKMLNIAFESPNKAMTIEFQGGEPLINWESLVFVVEEALKINKKKKKDLRIRIVTNLNLMSKEKLDYFVKKGIFLTSSLDGPRDIHNTNRPLIDRGKAKFENSYENVIYWIKYFKKEYKYFNKKGYQKKINALPTITKYSLKFPIEIVDEYISRGLGIIKLAPINPFGFSKKAWDKIGYNGNDFLKFYKEAFEHILFLNKNGKDIAEMTAVYYLKKIFFKKDPNMFEMRSPCGAGIGQISYNYDGKIYTCDEGRMLGEMGDNSFLLGDIDSNYEKIIDNSTTKSLCSASCLIGSAGCEDCAYLPYCGTCPIYNYSEQGNILGQMPTNERCKISKGILDYLFEKMQNDDNMNIFTKWIENIK